jgi:hypothetical protein
VPDAAYTIEAADANTGPWTFVQQVPLLTRPRRVTCTVEPAGERFYRLNAP